MSAPWEPQAYDLPDEPTDAEIRRAFLVLLNGGALGGAWWWAAACTNVVGEQPVSEFADEPELAAYERASELYAPLRAQPEATSALGKAGRGIVVRVDFAKRRVA